MKVVKPLKLGILHRSFEYQGRCFWAPTILAFFSFDGDNATLLPETQMWPFIAQELGREGVLDQGMPKEKAELLVVGSFFSPRRNRAPAGKARIKMAAIDKTLYIFGDRYWKRSANLVWSITDPEPMTSVPITYQNAFGGPGYKYNPLGKGAGAEDTDSGRQHPLPNVEDPDNLIGAPRDKPRPAGFGPIDQAWPQRFSKCGTYDQKWYETRFPGLADDIDWTFFNTAPSDQQIEGFFEGSERFSIESMHPDKPLVQASLPTIRPRCFITHQQKDSSTFVEINLNLDTVWLFPHAEKGVLIYHGLTEASSDTAKDITHLLVAYEHRSDPFRDLMHYHDALQKRLDKEKGAFAMLNETDLIAQGHTSAYAEMMAGEEISAMRGDQILQKKQRMRTDKDIQAVRAMIAGQGLDPDQVLPLPSAPAAFGDDLNFDQILIDAEKQRKTADQQLEQQLKALGMTREDFLQGAARNPAPRPSFSADQAIAAYTELGIRDPDLPAKMKQVEASFAKTYRMAGYALPPVIAPSSTEAEHKKQLLLSHYGAGEALRGADFSGLDLSGLDLEGIDLCDVLLEDAKLVGTNLRKANLKGIALLRSDLTGADLSGAMLANAGLGGCNFTNANLQGADLTEASLVRARLLKANLKNAGLEGADFSESEVVAAVFDHAIMRKTRFIEADLSTASFQHSDLSGALFYKTNLTGANLSAANLKTVLLIEVSAERSRFTGADLSNLRAAYKCLLSGVDFQDAKLPHCNFRGAVLTQSRFAGADLSHSDFSETDLSGCDFSRAIAKNALFIEANLSKARMVAANLFESLLHKAVLYDTDFKGANLYGVDFMKAEFRNTDVRLALTQKSTLDRWVPK